METQGKRGSGEEGRGYQRSLQSSVQTANASAEDSRMHVQNTGARIPTVSRDGQQIHVVHIQKREDSHVLFTLLTLNLAH